MKNLIIFFIALVALGSCNNSKTTKKEIPAGFENVSWESEKMHEYQLIRPIEFGNGAKDVYGLPVYSNEWYLVSFKSFYTLLPVRVSIDPTGPSFIDNVTKWKKIAVIDTVRPQLIKRVSSSFWGLANVSSIEIVCFKKGYQVWPSYIRTGQATVVIRED